MGFDLRVRLNEVGKAGFELFQVLHDLAELGNVVKEFEFHVTDGADSSGREGKSEGLHLVFFEKIYL